MFRSIAILIRIGSTRQSETSASDFPDRQTLKPLSVNSPLSALRCVPQQLIWNASAGRNPLVISMGTDS